MANKDIVQYNGKHRPVTTDTTRKVCLKSGVIRIPQKMFARMKNLQELDFCNNRELEEFHPECFYQCKKLAIIHWSSAHSLTTIGEAAFQETGIVVVASLPESLINIEQFAFSCCKKMTQFQTPVALKRLGGHSLQGCTRLSQVELNQGIQVLGPFAFGSTKKLTSIDIPNSLLRMGNDCFSGSGLQFLNIRFLCPDFSMGHDVFNECHFLSRVHLPLCMKILPRGTFRMCSGLRVVEFPLDLEMIDEGAFASSGIESLRFPSSLKVVGERAFYETKLQQATFPASTKQIRYAAFYGCRALTKVDFNSHSWQSAQLESIDGLAFGDTSELKSITIPADKLRSIGQAAFDHETIRTIQFVYNVQDPSNSRWSRIKIKTTIINGREAKRVELENLLPSADEANPQVVLRKLYGIRNMLGLTKESTGEDGSSPIHQELENNMNYEFLRGNMSGIARYN